MERWERPVRHHYRENPSFSSTLLDAIYRSIDDPASKREEELMICRETMRKKHGNGFKGADITKEKDLQRACIIEKWMEKKISYENVDVRRKSAADLQKKPRKEFDSVLMNSSSTSSESSCGGAFSSSESESVYGTLTSRSSSNYTTPRPKPIRTSISEPSETERYHQHHDRNAYATNQKPKGNSFVKTKSKALKIYGDLKKVKQPISPGGRLASFLNSIFTSANTKKAKLSSSSAGFDDRKFTKPPPAEPASTCSSASSFSRSCLSKTPSSSGKLSAKRSVRFYPVSVIVDEDCRPCGHKNLYGSEENLMAISTKRSSSTNEELKYRVMSENRRVEEVARDLLKNYQKNKEVNMRDVILCNDSEEEEEDDDMASCASSDLFELDNLSVIGIERYHEELPVYETTHLDTNRAIADGLIL